MMILAERCARSRAHFLLILLSVCLWGSTIPCWAHPVVFSEYSLEYIDQHWILSFSQKTSQLRDVVYAKHPNLRGMNLNSKAFLDATEQHIFTGISLQSDDEKLRFTRNDMQFGGLKFESSFKVSGLQDLPDFLDIEINTFGVHEHSIVIFRIIESKEGFLHYFNKNDMRAVFDFKSNRYLTSIPQSNSTLISSLIALGAVVLIVVVIIIKRPGTRITCY